MAIADDGKDMNDDDENDDDKFDPDDALDVDDWIDDQIAQWVIQMMQTMKTPTRIPF